MCDIATCSKCKTPNQRDCAACPFNCDLHPNCQDQGCEADKQNCKRVQDRERDISNGKATCAADWIAQQEAKNQPPESAQMAWGALCELERLMTPKIDLAFTRMTCPGCARFIDFCDCHPLSAPYGVKYIHESNPGGDPYGWVAQMFMRQQEEKPMGSLEIATKWLGQIIAPIYLYLCGIAAAIIIAASTPAPAYAPMVCRYDGFYRVCTVMTVNPSAKIIHIDPPIEREPVYAAPPVEIRSVPLPRPRPLNLGEPQVNVAPIDRPRQVIQQ